MRKILLIIPLLISILFVASLYPQGRTIGIFVDGSYDTSPKDTDMDKLLDKRIQDAMDAMKSKDSTSEMTKVEHKVDLEKKLKNLHCKCGDEVVLYMIGHGEGTGGKSSYAFHFSKDKGSRVTPDELRKWLDAASDECCCKIHVVIFSCHSGSFHSTSDFDKDGLFNAEHLVSLFTSSTKDEKSYSDTRTEGGKLIDGGDWAKGFGEDWKASKKKNMVDVLIESAESAKEKMPDKFNDTQHPQGWVRGEFEIYGHVEERRRAKNWGKITELKVHFYEPDFLKCTTKWIKVDGINVDTTINACSWIRDSIRTGKPSKPIIGITDVIKTEAPTEKTSSQIEKVDRTNKTLLVHVVSPGWLYGKHIKIKVEEPGQIDPGLRECNWTDLNIKVIDPPENQNGEDGKYSTTDFVTAKDKTLNCSVHIERINGESNLIDVNILDPSWLKCRQYNNVLVPQGEIDKLENIEGYSIIKADVTFHKSNSISISNIKIPINKESLNRFLLDAAVKNVQQLNVDTSGIFYPEVSVTNVGDETISFPVIVAIANPEELGLIQQWWQTGQGTPQCLWYETVEVENLPPAETRTISFSAFQLPQSGENYWVGFRTSLEGDENPASDTASSFIIPLHQPNTPPLLQNPFVQPPAGTVQTQFVFQVIYIDQDGDEPVQHQVIIDNNLPFDLVAGQGTVETGKQFYIQTHLPAGFHNFFFRFDDGQGNQVTTDVFPGPDVR